MTDSVDASEQRVPALMQPGRCPVCEGAVTFIAFGEWLRDELFCPNCRSLPRERALFHVLRSYFPNWPGLTIHESSPGVGGASRALAEQAVGYVPSHFFPDLPLGGNVRTFRNENLESLTFADSVFDLHVTQDVVEHVLDPDRAFSELARTLKPGGAHVFTTPIVNGYGASVVRARRGANGVVEKLLPGVYHGNPIDQTGALVTVDWGMDICNRIFKASGMFTVVHAIQEPSIGVLGAYTEVLVSWKERTDQAAVL